MNTKTHQLVQIPIDGLKIEGELIVPAKAKGLVIFAHGSGSGRHSPRNKFVAEELQKNSLATLLVDLLSEEEDADYQNRFNIPLLTERLTAITDWATHNKATENLNIGYFGASTGAAAAMFAAKGAEDIIKGFVSRGGRVDLAGEVIQNFTVPSLLIVGQQDFDVLEANRQIYNQLQCTKDFVEVPNATHLFEEPGGLEKVAGLATAWFKKYLG